MHRDSAHCNISRIQQNTQVNECWSQHTTQDDASDTKQENMNSYIPYGEKYTDKGNKRRTHCSGRTLKPDPCSIKALLGPSSLESPLSSAESLLLFSAPSRSLSALLFAFSPPPFSSSHGPSQVHSPSHSLLQPIEGRWRNLTQNATISVCVCCQYECIHVCIAHHCHLRSASSLFPSAWI